MDITMEKISTFNFGELGNDTDFVKKVHDMDRYLDDISKLIEEAEVIKSNQYESLSLKEKVDLDLFLAFAINSCYWIHLRLGGVDTQNHPVKTELSRIKEAINRHKQAVESVTIRPKLNKAAAGRFVRSGMWDPKNPSSDSPPNKKIKLSDKN